MSYIPTLKTPVFDRRTRETNSGRTTARTTRPSVNRVRFDTIDRSRTPISLTQRERERRKNDALNFLRKETNENDKRRSNRTELGASRSNYGSNSQSNSRFKTFELLNDEPISKLNKYSAGSILNESEKIRNSLKFENIKKSRFDPFGYDRTSRISDMNSKINKPRNKRNDNGLLNSISNFGSKIINSILYNEEDTSVRNFGSRAIDNKDVNEELNLKLIEKKMYLDKLNKEIERKELEMKKLNQNNSHNNSTNGTTDETTINDLNLRIDNLISEFKMNSNINYLDELNSLKDDLKILKRLQDSNNFKINNKFQDFKIENQLNFEKLLKTVKNVKENAESNSMPQKKSRMNTISNFDCERIDSDDSIESKDSDDSIDSLDSDDKDILNYIIKNRSNKNIGNANSKLRNKIKRIKDNLKNIEEITSK